MVYFLVFVGLLTTHKLIVHLAVRFLVSPEKQIKKRDKTFQPWSVAQWQYGVRTLIVIAVALYLAWQITACKSKPAPANVPTNTVDTTRQRLERTAQRSKARKDFLRSTSQTAKPYASSKAHYDSVRAHLR